MELFQVMNMIRPQKGIAKWTLFAGLFLSSTFVWGDSQHKKSFQEIKSSLNSIKKLRSQNLESKEIFLSFEERVIASYLLESIDKTEFEKIDLYKRFLTFFKSHLSKSPGIEAEEDFSDFADKYSGAHEKVVDYFDQHLSQSIPTKDVKNFEEFLENYRGQFPSTGFLSEDLKLLEKDTSQHGFKVIVSSQSPRVQAKIENFYLLQGFAQYDQVKDQAEDSVSSLQLRFFVLVKNLLKELKKEAYLQAHSDGKLKPGSESQGYIGWKLSLKEAEDLFHVAITSIENIGKQIASSDQVNFENKGHQVFIETVLTEYFSRMDIDSKKQIISNILSQNLLMSDQDKFIQMVLSSGPQFQKLLQVIGRESGLSEDLRIVFQKLESSTLPVSDLVVKNIFESERANYDWVSYELKPLGVGTMAQVHRAKVRMNGKIKSVVVRFLKPGIEKRVYEDKRILSEIAPILDSNHVYLASGLPKLTPLVEDLSKTIIAELDLKATVDRQNMGYRVYRGSKTVDLGGYKNILKIQVPQVYWPTTPTKLMVQDMVFGKKLEKVSQQYESVLPKMKKAVAELVAEVWIEEVLFKSGFFHSDLHQGNFMVEFREDETKVNLIDFGMGGQISSTTQGAALALGVAVELLKPETITESLWDLSEQAHNLLLKTQFRALVDAKVLNIKHGLESGVKVEDWVAWAIQKGIKFPFIFISLNRGFGIINNMLKEAGSSHTLATISKKVGLKYALNIAKDLVDNESVTAKELVKLGLGIKKVPARCENIFMK